MAEGRFAGADAARETAAHLEPSTTVHAWVQPHEALQKPRSCVLLLRRRCVRVVSRGAVELRTEPGKNCSESSIPSLFADQTHIYPRRRTKLLSIRWAFSSALVALSRSTRGQQ